MAVVISEIITETAITGGGAAPAASASPIDPDVLDVIVRRAGERVLETLRREWDG